MPRSPLSTPTLKVLLFLLFAFLEATSTAWAVRPLSAPFAVVAGGSCRAGNKDGSFTTAQFNTPLGLAIDPEGNNLYVADSNNHRIRIVHLDKKNEVTTLAGREAGDADGPLASASFNHPHGLLYLPGDRLVVNDAGNQILRLIDLKVGTVTTLAGGRNGSANDSSGPALKASMAGIQDMAYMASSDSIFFTQPDMKSIKRLDLKTSQVSIVLEKHTQLENPGPIWCQDNQLYVADRSFPQIYLIDWKGVKAPAVPTGFSSPLTQVLALSANGGILYSLLANPGMPAQRFFMNGLDLENERKDGYNKQFNNGMVQFRSPWGDKLPPEKILPSGGAYPPPIGFVADPNDSRKFYVARPDFHMIVAFRDLFGFDWHPSEGERNSNGIDEPEYPQKKPRNTYRILIVGDSRSAEVQNYPFQSDFHCLKRPDGGIESPHNLSLAPQLERELNFLAALDEVPLNYEVFNYSKHGEYELWPTYEVPKVVQRNDIDLVILYMTDHFPFEFYFDHPITKEGIPQYPNDMEYLLKPPMERIAKGLPKKFYDICKAHKWVSIVGKSFKFDGSMVFSTDPEVQDILAEMYGKPIDILNKKISAMQSSLGQPVRLMLCNMSTSRAWEKNPDMPIWRHAAKMFNFPIWDMDDRTDALNYSFQPLTGDGSHLDPDGALYYAKLFAHELIREKLIPWESGTK